jgi:hypothetical protein
MYSFKGGSPLRPHIKVGPTATHPARVADCYRFQFSSHPFSQSTALESTPTINLYRAVRHLF